MTKIKILIKSSKKGFQAPKIKLIRTIKNTFKKRPDKRRR